MKSSALIISVIFFVLLLGGCRRIEYVSVPEVHTKYETQFVHDTQYHDHFYTDYFLGDTLVIRDSIYYFTAQITHDTVRSIDSIPVTDTAALFALRRDYDRLTDSYVGLKWLFGIFIVIVLSLTIYRYAKKADS